MNATAIKLSVRQWAEEDRPSTKLQNLGVQALSDSELLSILIGSGTTQHNAVEIGSMILSNFDRDLAKLSKADFRELKEVEGVGTYTACKILAAIELGRDSCRHRAGKAQTVCHDGTFSRPLLCHGHLQLHAPEDAGLEGGGGSRHPHESELQAHQEHQAEPGRDF